MHELYILYGYIRVRVLHVDHKNTYKKHTFEARQSIECWFARLTFRACNYRLLILVSNRYTFLI